MELIVAILVFVLIFANAGSKNKKGKAPAGKQGATPQRDGKRTAAPRTLREAINEAAQDMGIPVSADALEWEEANGQAAVKREPKPVAVAPTRAQGRSMLEDEECKGGSMPHVHTEGHSALEDEDCFGGSMEHIHSEGVNRAAHARRMAAIDAAHDEDILPETIDARALRRAVVMAEVLGKPRALKRAR